MLVGWNAVSISYGILQQKSCHAARVKQAGQDMNTAHSSMQVEETITRHGKALCQIKHQIKM
jgi:hypothetical protein